MVKTVNKSQITTYCTYMQLGITKMVDVAPAHAMRYTGKAEV
jgi:hypothetical protein